MFSVEILSFTVFIKLYESQSQISIYLFSYLFNFCVRGYAHIFFVLITHEIALDTRLYVIVFLFL